MGVFKVLMWKHWVVRKRRYVQTIIEFVTPISLILTVFILKEPMQKKAGGEKLMVRKPFPNLTFSLDKVNPPATILYTPDTNVAYDLMMEVTSTLKNISKNIVQEPKNDVVSLAFPNATLAVDTLLLLTSRTKNVYAMVEFEDMKGDKLPNVLEYTIRMTALMSIGPTVRFQRLFEKFENVPQPFLSLQWAIDRSFIKLKSNNKWIAKKVIFQPLSKESLEGTLNKTYVSTVFFLLSYISFGAPLLPFVFLMNRLLEERSTGIQELVKMEGVTDTMLGITQFLNTLPSVLIYCIGGLILMKSTETPMVPKTHPVILFTGQFLHFMTMIAMAFACSHLSGDAQHSITMSIFVYIGMWIPIKLMGAYSTSDVILFLLGLLPHCPSYWFLNEALVAEIRFEVGIQFHSLTERFSTYPGGEKNACVLVAFLMQLLQITILFTLNWFLDKVIPGKFGVAKPWNFLITKDYWSGRKKIPQDAPVETTAPYDPAYNKYFETPPSNMEAGIIIQSVSKIFGIGSKNEFKALNNVNLNIYKGEITVLLGHNGAGKTTLISIITGMIKQTSGKIYVNGKDTVTQQDEVRKQLGFCPQHNLFFPDLTVLEHFMFFSLIKGGSFDDAKTSSYALMEQLDLRRHENKKTSHLSGGLLRRLQLGCALCGDASVLILDEPTSGLDVEARRELWDTLLSLRGDRTLVLTTHFMEEADVLGDRMAALHLGKLRCHATPMFLKKAVGSGFRINVNTKHDPDEDKITSTIKSVEPSAELNEKSVRGLVYILPPGANVLPVFKSLEEKKEELQIDSLGVGVTSLEEVFLELCCDVDIEKRSDAANERTREQFIYVTGVRLLYRQTKELVKRQIDYTKANAFAFTLLHILMPFVLCTSLTQIFNILDNERTLELSLDLDMYTDTGLKDTIFSLKSNGSRRAMSFMRNAYPNFEFTNILDFPYIHSNEMAYRSGATYTEMNLTKYMAGIAINEAGATVLYTPNLKHSAPVGLNLLSNVMAINTLPHAHGKTIVTKLTNNWPLSTKPYHLPKTKINCSLFAIFNICTLIATTLNDMSLPTKERLTVARHTHIMAGCSPFLYWLITFLYHMFFYLSFSCTATLIAAAYFDNDHTIDDKATLQAMFVVLILSGMNIYAFMYFITFCFDERSASMILVFTAICFGFLIPILLLAVEDLKTDPEETLLSRVMNVVGSFIPVYMFTKSLIQVTDISRFNSFCKHNGHKCPNLQSYTEGFSPTLCCQNLKSGSNNPFSHYAFDRYGAGKSILTILLQLTCYMSLVFFLQYGLFNRWWDRLGTLFQTSYPYHRFNCSNVNDEKTYVLNRIQQGKDKMTDAILVSKAWKVYRGLLMRKNFALKGISFSIKKGECFGILGLNGAGKTTTFKLITTEESMTKGKIFVNGHSNGGEYLRSLGYCPQFCGLDSFRSGRANLRMLLILRGLSDNDVKMETAVWLAVVGMTKYAHREVAGYSGGMVRRLATTASLCSGAPLTLLDEPTAGVDTAARRLVWAALQKGVQHDRAIAISSHCMDEIEKLCKRVTILTLGEMAVLGTPQALKDVYAPGHTIVFKLKAEMAQSLTGQEIILRLKKTLDRQFNCSMKDKHLTSLHYRINEKLPYSEIFTKLENISGEYSDLIEDYSVSDTTMENVFLAFAGQSDTSPLVSKISIDKSSASL